jgi:hypothetical protein
MGENEVEVQPFAELGEAPPASRRLARILSDANVLGDDELLVVQKQHPGEYLGDVLVREGILLESYLYGLLIRTLYLPWAAIDRCRVSPDTVSLLTEDFCRERRIMPINRARDFLTISCVNPLDEESIDEVRNITGMNVRVVLCSPEQQTTLMRIAFAAKDDEPEENETPEDEDGENEAEAAEAEASLDVGVKAAELADQLMSQEERGEQKAPAEAPDDQDDGANENDHAD